MIGIISSLFIRSAENLITVWKEGSNRKSEILIEIRKHEGQVWKHVGTQ
jgi:hypothetical protein